MASPDPAGETSDVPKSLVAYEISVGMSAPVQCTICYTDEDDLDRSVCKLMGCEDYTAAFAVGLSNGKLAIVCIDVDTNDKPRNDAATKITQSPIGIHGNVLITAMAMSEETKQSDHASMTLADLEEFMTVCKTKWSAKVTL